MFKRVEGTSEPLTLIGSRKHVKLRVVSFFMHFSFDMFEEIFRQSYNFSLLSFGYQGRFPQY